jgi:signal transduction histidine kinase
MSTPGSAAGRGAARRSVLWAALILATATALWLASRWSYLLFHSTAEVFSISIAVCVFLFSWSSRGDAAARPFVILGIGYLFVAIVDLLHTLSYQGMNILGYVRDEPTKLWVAARALQAAVTLVFADHIRRRRVPHVPLAFAVVGVATALLLAAIFWWDVFPVCYVQGVGLTPFKIASEYAISAVFGLSIVFLWRKREALPAQVRGLLIAGFAVTIASELSFTAYVDAYGYMNLLGHYLKIASLYLAYQALVGTQVRQRITLIEELERSKAALLASEAELRRADQSKDRFFSIIAHDLRNPIGGLLNLSELLARRFDALSTEKVRELAQHIYEASSRGAELLESILLWARAHTGRMVPSPSCVRLGELCEGVTSAHRAVARRKDVSMVCEVPEDSVAYADENMLATVLRNLLSNAVKFTPRNGEIRLTSVPAGDRVELQVRDNGVGIGPEDLQKLFRIDMQVTRHGTEGEPGNGMGLILCRELVELNRGSITVRSEPGMGSTFTVRVPASVAALA